MFIDCGSGNVFRIMIVQAECRNKKVLTIKNSAVFKITGTALSIRLATMRHGTRFCARGMTMAQFAAIKTVFISVATACESLGSEKANAEEHNK